MNAILIRRRFGTRMCALLLLGGILLWGLTLRPVPSKPTWAAPPHRSGSVDPTTGYYLGTGTKRMAALVKTMTTAPNSARDSIAWSAQRIQSLQRRVKRTPAPNIRLSLLGQLAEDLLNAGRTEEALRAYDDYARVAQQFYPDFYQKELKWMAEKNVAMCYLRLGEQQNCCANNNADSCLLPIRGGGIHTKQFGSREGVKRLTRLLEAYPTDVSTRWSLNIAYMTLGEYPDKVPSRWRIPPEVFKSEAAIPRFPNLAPQKGLALEGLAGGCVIEDFDCDMAFYAGQAQRHAAAAHFLARAQQALPGNLRQSPGEHWHLSYFRLTKARVLLSGGKPTEAMEWLPTPATGGDGRIHELLVWAETYLAAGEKAMASRHLNEVDALLVNTPLLQRRNKLDRLAKQL